MPEKSRRILVFTTAYAPLIGGSELALENIIRHLPNIFFDVLTPRYKKIFPSEELGSNFKIKRLGWGSFFDKFFFPILGFWQAVKLNKMERYSTVHAYQASYGGGAGWLFKTFFPGTNFIVTLQEGKELNKQRRFIKFFRRLILKKANIITVISNYLLEQAKRINAKAEVSLIPNGVDIVKFNSAVEPEPRTNLGVNIKPSDKVIITISRLVAKNGLAGLIDSFRSVKEKVPGAKLVIIGGGQLKSELEYKVEKSNLKNDIFLKDEIEHAKIPAYLRAADVFVRPSLSEGLGTAFLEAMAVGLPVVGSTVVAGVRTGIADFITEGETGLSCDPKDPVDIGKKITAILSDSDLAKRLSVGGQILVRAKYTWDKVAEKFKLIYEG